MTNSKEPWPALTDLVTLRSLHSGTSLVPSLLYSDLFPFGTVAITIPVIHKSSFLSHNRR
jgi:hypothetical protein